MNNSWSDFYFSLSLDKNPDYLDEAHKSSFVPFVEKALQYVELKLVDLDDSIHNLWQMYFLFQFNEALLLLRHADSDDNMDRISMSEFLVTIPINSAPDCHKYESDREALIYELSIKAEQKLSFTTRCAKPENVPKWVINMWMKFYGCRQSAEYE